jgi:hypothetical protein
MLAPFQVYRNDASMDEKFRLLIADLRATESAKGTASVLPVQAHSELIACAWRYSR